MVLWTQSPALQSVERSPPLAQENREIETKEGDCLSRRGGGGCVPQHPLKAPLRSALSGHPEVSGKVRGARPTRSFGRRWAPCPRRKRGCPPNAQLWAALGATTPDPLKAPLRFALSGHPTFQEKSRAPAQREALGGVGGCDFIDPLKAPLRSALSGHPRFQEKSRVPAHREAMGGVGGRVRGESEGAHPTRSYGRRWGLCSPSSAQSSAALRVERAPAGARRASVPTGPTGPSRMVVQLGIYPLCARTAVAQGGRWAGWSKVFYPSARQGVGRDARFGVTACARTETVRGGRGRGACRDARPRE